MSHVRCTVVFALTLLCPLPASAHGWPWGSRGGTVSYYAAVPVIVYQPVPILVAPPLLVCPPQAPPIPMAPVWARPTPAPPSAGPAPIPQAPPAAAPESPGLPAPPPGSPLTPPPNVREEKRSFYYDAFAVAPRTDDRPGSARCTVAFWNLTGRTVTLKLDGQAHVLASGQALSRALGREFVWQVEGHDPQRQTLPAGEAGLEIVIRQ